MSRRQQQRWLRILDRLFNAEINEGFSADELALDSEFSAIDDEEQRITAFVRYKVKNASTHLLQQIGQLENALIKLLQEQMPDVYTEEWQFLSIRQVNQHLLDLDFKKSNPEVLRLLLVSMSKDGQGLAGNKGSLFIRYTAQDQYRIK